MGAPFVVVASARPACWERIRAAIAEHVAIAFAVDLRGTLDLLREQAQPLLVLCARVIDAAAEQVLDAVKREIPDAVVILVGDSQGRSGQVPADAHLAVDAIECDLLALVREHLGPRPRAGAARSAPGHELRRSGPMVVGDDPRMSHLLATARQMAQVDATVLICGETGTGKELLARWIHQRSARAAGPFVTIDLPTVPDALFESILFGHERGSFTGAMSPSPGKFQQARGGTLFLDEISSLKLELQPKLLRAIQEKEVESVGAREPTRCDVRIIAATNVDLKAEIARGTFRADLFYRLDVLTLPVPALRDRRADVPLLVDFFFDKYCRQLGRPRPTLSTGAAARLAAHPFPGNIRELENRVQRAALLCVSERIEEADIFGDEPTAGAPAAIFGDEELSLEEVERLYIEHVLQRTTGNQSHAAQILQIDRKTLRAKLQRYAAAGSPQAKRILRSVS